MEFCLCILGVEVISVSLTTATDEEKPENPEDRGETGVSAVCAVSRTPLVGFVPTHLERGYEE